jgi:hypothetical protein
MVGMKTPKKRTWSFPPNADANLGGEKVYKRPAYNLAYFLLTFAYNPAYHPAYLQATEKTESHAIFPMRPILWIENFIRHSPAC